MLSASETVQILKRVHMFADTPDEVLFNAVSFFTTVTVPGGATVFHKGEPGDSMYVIVTGQIRVHDGEMTLNFLDQHAVFGEMAALDPEPRSATATAATDTLLLRLAQQDFAALMQQRAEVLQGVIHVLCQRLRARMRDLHSDYNYMQQFARVTAAAAAVEANVFEPESLAEVAARTDELGQLARVFQRMAREVYAREQRLKREVHDLRIEIDQFRTSSQVAAITDSDYFQDLQRKAETLRQQISERE